jgi:hypothetical protein
MRVITAPLDSPPHACLVTGREDGEFCDFETDVICDEFPHVYIKRDVVEAAARELGMVPAEEVVEIRRQVAEWGQKLDDVLDSLSLAADFEEQFNRLRST